MEKSELLKQLHIDRSDTEAPLSRTHWIVLLGCVLLVLTGVWIWFALILPEPFTVRTAVARAASQAPGVGSVLDASGYVTARRQATVSAKITGKVAEILIEEGMRVKEGDVLARLDDTEAKAQLALYQNDSNAFPVFAVDPRRYLDMYPEFTIATAQRQAFIKTRTGAVAGQRLVERYGWQLGQKLPISSEIYPKVDGSMSWEFDLVGMLDADDPAVRGNTDLVLINGEYFDEARQSNKGRTGWYIERIADPAQGRAISAAIDALFMNSPDETKTQPEKEFAIGFAKQVGDIGVLVRRILAAVFFTILLLTGNTMAQSMRERIPEFAILKTLGFSDGKVTALVLAEAVVMLLLGGGLGMLAATSLLPALNGATGGRFPALFVNGSAWLVALGIAVVLALAIGLHPALRAWRLKIVEALAGH